MIWGIGTDIIEIDRIAAAMERKGFAEKIFTPSERAFLQTKKAPSAAGLFAAKEAAIKAVGGGVKEWQDIEITHSDAGAPLMTVKGYSGTFWCSISHCRSYAVAQVVYEAE